MSLISDFNLLAVPSAVAMKVINTNQLVKIPEGVEASVKSRVVTVKVRRIGAVRHDLPKLLALHALWFITATGK